jgi:hypothetical protein
VLIQELNDWDCCHIHADTTPPELHVREYLDPTQVGIYGSRDPFYVARIYLCRVIERWLAGKFSPRMLAPPPQEFMRFGFEPDSLLSAGWLQFALAIDGDKEHRQCQRQACGKWFELSPEVTRADRRFCSDACRTRTYRQRQATARDLSAKGVPLEDIARELATNEGTVQGWVRQKEQRYKETVARAPGCPQKTFIVKFGFEPLRQEGNTMFGPGAYRPDPSAGITAPADLPQPEIVPYSRNDIRQPCPRCGHSAYRDKQAHRTLHDLGNLDVWCPRDLLVTYSQHYCTKCRKYFSADLSALAPPGSQYTHRVIELAVRIVVEDGVPYRLASWHLWRDHRVFVPFATIQNWVEAGGKKGTVAHGHRVP